MLCSGLALIAMIYFITGSSFSEFCSELRRLLQVLLQRAAEEALADLDAVVNIRVSQLFYNLFCGHVVLEHKVADQADGG